ncbi:MAG TPA: phosphatidylglycerol lysyltransferase domain-containing protein [Acidimicrobiales bacterium]|nr:phosphatidylglycerol lysyltransferase domain-containing protein [Acidimicrobiales bacterium]
MAEPVVAGARPAPWPLRVGGLACGVVVGTAAALGWLYWAAPGSAAWLWPPLPDGLPLDELASHSSVPLVLFLASFGVVAAGLGRLARWAGMDRLTAAFVLTLGVGGWLLVVDALCLYVVRQSGAAAALRSAEALPAVYVAAGLAGLAGAWAGREVAATHRWRGPLSAAVAAAGALDLVSAAFPRFTGRVHLLERAAPDLLVAGAGVAVVPVGVALLLSARALHRGSRRAWLVAVGLLACSAALHLLKGLDYEEAVLTGALGLALFAARDSFPAPGDPASATPALGRALGAVGGAYLYALGALFVNRTAADLPFGFLQAARAAALAVVGVPDHGGPGLARDFPTWLPASATSILALGLGWALAGALAPGRHRLEVSSRRRQAAAQLVRRWGADTLAPFILRADKDLFLHPASGPAAVVVAYRVVRGVAIVSGDPVGRPERHAEAFEAFCRYCSERGWAIGVLGVCAGHLPMYRAAGLRALYHGDEAVVDVEEFSLEGPPMRTVRQGVHRVRRHGYVSQVAFAGDLDRALKDEMAAIEAAWIGPKPRRGFVMELDDLFRLGGRDAVFVLGRDGQGRLRGFLHLCVCHPSATLSLSSMPRERDTPNGFNAWLVAEAAAWCRQAGYGAISLNFSPFAGLLGEADDPSLTRRVQREALLRIKSVLSLQLDNLYLFNRRFAPRWVPRYVVYESRLALPRVALAALAAEGYLPERLARKPGRQNGPEAYRAGP